MFNKLEFENSMKIKNLKLKINQKGFTLIELLVVIAIIGILASFAIASFNSARLKGRDSRRKADFDALVKALELSRSNSQAASYYPNCPGGLSLCELSTSSQTDPPIAPTYIKSVPSDPIFGGGNCSASDLSFTYCYIPTECPTTTACSKYELYACLENSNEPVRGNVEDDITGTCPSVKMLHIINP